jgi:membrane associated rhomboid family serine protease
MFPLYDDVPARRTPLVMIALIVMNIVVFVWWRQLPSFEKQVVAFQWGFVPARAGQLAEHEDLAIALEQPDDPFWGPQPPRQIVLPPRPGQIAATLFTCMFLHGSWLHLLGNMWFLWIFGNNVEDRLGHVPFLVLYLLGGVLASGVHWAASPSSAMPVIGASGAIATVLGAYAITWPWARVYTLVFIVVFFTVVELPALVVLGVWFLLQIFSVTLGGQQEVGQSVAWWAHIGGFVAGVILMPMMSGLVGNSPDPATYPLPPPDEPMA